MNVEQILLSEGFIPARLISYERNLVRRFQEQGITIWPMAIHKENYFSTKIPYKWAVVTITRALKDAESVAGRTDWRLNGCSISRMEAAEWLLQLLKKQHHECSLILLERVRELTLEDIYLNTLLGNHCIYLADIILSRLMAESLVKSTCNLFVASFLGEDVLFYAPSKEGLLPLLEQLEKKYLFQQCVSA